MLSTFKSDTKWLQNGAKNVNPATFFQKPRFDFFSSYLAPSWALKFMISLFKSGRKWRQNGAKKVKPATFFQKAKIRLFSFGLAPSWALKLMLSLFKSEAKWCQNGAKKVEFAKFFRNFCLAPSMGTKIDGFSFHKWSKMASERS